MIQLINDFFNDPEFWNQTGIIFTRCYSDVIEESDRKMAQEEYRACLIDFITKLPGCVKIKPEIPCFFVDSKNWETDQATQNEYKKALAFAVKFPPVPTQNLKVVNPDYQKEEDEIITGVLVNYDERNSGNKKILTYYYEDQKRKKITGYNGDIVYTEPEVIKSYTKTDEIDISKPTPPPPIIIHHHKSGGCSIF